MAYQQLVFLGQGYHLGEEIQIGDTCRGIVGVIQPQHLGPSQSMLWNCL